MTLQSHGNYTNAHSLLPKDIQGVLFLPYEIINTARPHTPFTRFYDYLRRRLNREYTSDLKCKLFVALYRLDDSRLGVLLMRMDNISSVQGDLAFYYKPIDRLWRDTVGWPVPLELVLGNGLLRIAIPANPDTEVLRLTVSGTSGAAAMLPRTIRDIPRKIFQIWGDPDVDDSPRIIQKALATYRTLNPHYEHFYFGDDAARQYIAEHEPVHVLDAYDQLRPLAYKADFWRYIVLYHEGGVYADAKSIALAPLDAWLPTQRGVLVNDIRGAGILNALMAMPPRDPLMRLAIDEIVKNVRERYYGRGPLDITGPRLLARCLDRLGDTSYTRLQFDNTGILIRDPLRNLVVASQHNGEYRRLVSRPGMQQHYESFWLNRTVYGEQPQAEAGGRDNGLGLLSRVSASHIGIVFIVIAAAASLLILYRRRRQALRLTARRTARHAHHH